VTQVGDIFQKASLEPAIKVIGRHLDRFVPFGGIDFRKTDDRDWDDYVKSKLEHDISLGAKGLKIYKELGLRYRDSLGNLIMPDDKRLKSLWQAAAELNIPVLYHIADPLTAFLKPENEFNEEIDQTSKWWWGAPGFPSHEELIQSMFKLAAENPHTTFVFPHCASLTHDLKRVTEFVNKYPNVYVDVSARLDTLARQPRSARDFFINAADKILWGSDDMWPNRDNAYHLWFRFLETEDDYFIGNYYGSRPNWHFYGINLPDTVLQKIYNINAANLLNIKI
ncbi:MAG: amidohydrolase family protein, partial [Planctomycetota bacterium]